MPVIPSFLESISSRVASHAEARRTSQTPCASRAPNEKCRPTETPCRHLEAGVHRNTEVSKTARGDSAIRKTGGEIPRKCEVCSQDVQHDHGWPFSATCGLKIFGVYGVIRGVGRLDRRGKPNGRDPIRFGSSEQFDFHRKRRRFELELGGTSTSSAVGRNETSPRSIPPSIAATTNRAGKVIAGIPVQAWRCRIRPQFLRYPPSDPEGNGASPSMPRYPLDLRTLEPKRVLILKPSSLGDVVHALPTLAALKDRWPSAQFSWLVNRGLRRFDRRKPVARRGDPLRPRRNRLPCDRRSRHPQGRPRTASPGSFDLAIDLQGLLRSGLLTAATGAPVRVGLATAREGSTRFYTHRIGPPADSEHAVDRLLEVARAFGADVSPSAFRGRDHGRRSAVGS